MSELTEHGRKALERCIREHQNFIRLADDYDLDEMSVQALQTAIESMQMRLDANAKPAAGPSEHDESWAEMIEHDYDTAVRGAVISKPVGVQAVAYMRRSVTYKAVDGRFDGERIISERQVYPDDLPLYTHPQPVTPAGGEVEPVAWLHKDGYTMMLDKESHRFTHPEYWTALYTHPPVADAALPRGHRVDDGKQLAMIRDAERLDWLEQVAFTTYRTRDPETGRLYSHVTFVNEDKAPRRGITRDSFRESIDAAMQDAALNQRGGWDHG